MRHSGSPSKGQQQQLKVIIRRLPPNIPEGIFWSSVDEFVSDKKCIAWKAFHQGKLGSSKHKENVPSVAYIQFSNLEALVAFAKVYQGHFFKDSKGNVAEALVEFAPFQRVPRHCKPDPKQGTIHDDPEFKAFLEDPSAVIHNEAPADHLNPEVTPLVDFIKKKHEQKASAKKAAKGSNAPGGPKGTPVILTKDNKDVAVGGSGKSSEPASSKKSTKEKSKSKKEKAKEKEKAAAAGANNEKKSDIANGEDDKPASTSNKKGKNAKGKKTNAQQQQQQQQAQAPVYPEPPLKPGLVRTEAPNAAQKSQQQQHSAPNQAQQGDKKPAKEKPQPKPKNPNGGGHKRGNNNNNNAPNSPQETAKESGAQTKGGGQPPKSNNNSGGQAGSGPGGGAPSRRNRLNPNNRLLNAALGGQAPPPRFRNASGSGGQPPAPAPGPT